MRLLMTTDTVGGVWNFTTTLTQELLNRGHSVHLVSFGRQPSPNQQAWADQLSATPHHHPPVISTGGEAGAERSLYSSRHTDSFTTNSTPAFTYLPTAIPLEWMQNNEAAVELGPTALLEALSNHPLDLIVSNQFCFGRLNTAIPRIVVAHSDVLGWAKACKPSALAPSPWLNRYTSIVQAGLLEAAAVVAPTTWMGKALAEHFFLPRSFTVIPNGTAVEAAPNPEPQRKWQTITAGRLWDEAKGLDTLRDLPLRMPLLVAGENSFESPDPAASWPGNLTRLGPLSPAALHQHFRQSDVYLCTSRYEPFGLAPLEAALCGCAVIVRDLPSLREVWADGALYYDDTGSLVTLLQALGHDVRRLGEAASRAGQRAALFTPQRMTDSYLNLFCSVLGTASTPAHAA